MKRLLLVLLAGWPVAGCGPMVAPLPMRLDNDAQAAIDLSWEKALTPVGALDHQALLDVLIHSNAYQFGVDRLLFRSEKRYSGGTVVMEVEFHRQASAMDRFEVSMHQEYGQLRQKNAQQTLTVEEQARLASLEARRRTIKTLFPIVRTHLPSESPGR